MDNFEKIFKEKLHNIEIQTSDKVWKNVSEALIKRQRIKRFLIYFITVTGIAFILGLGFYLLKSRTNSKENSNQNSKVIAKVSKEINKNSTKSYNHINPVKSSTKQNTPDIFSGYDKILNSNINFNNNHTTSYQPKSSKYLRTILNQENIEHKNIFQNQLSKTSNIHKNTTGIKKYDNFSKPIVLKSSKTEYLLLNNRIFNPTIKPQHGILNDCFSDGANRWFMDLYLSPDYAKKSLTGTKPEYINSRLSSESALLSYSGGIMAGYKFNKNILIKTGLNFTTINEKFHIVIKDVKNTQTIITIDTIWNTDGTYQISRDTTIKEIYGKEDIQKINNYSMIDIPVIFGYQFKHNDFNIGINAGIVLNILTYQKGTMLNMNGEVVSFNKQSDNPDIFNKNLGISIYTSAYFGYRINRNIELFAEPKFRYFLKPFTNNNYPLTQKFTKFGISLGPRYFFN